MYYHLHIFPRISWATLYSLQPGTSKCDHNCKCFCLPGFSKCVSTASVFSSLLLVTALCAPLILHFPVPVGHWRPLLTTASIMQVSNVCAPSDKLQPPSLLSVLRLATQTHTYPCINTQPKCETNESSWEVLTLH